MRTVIIDGVEHTVPEISSITDGDKVIHTIEEGEHTGIKFAIVNMRVDDTDDHVMWYDLEAEDEKHVDLIKPMVDSFILMILLDGVERIKNETDQERNPDA
jgi:hypothetical protein